MALEMRVSLQRLLIGLIVVIVPLSILGLYLTSESNGNRRALADDCADRRSRSLAIH
jgi:hypothetical protein